MSSSDSKGAATGVVEDEISALQKDLLDLINVDDSGVNSSAADVDDDEEHEEEDEVVEEDGDGDQVQQVEDSAHQGQLETSQHARHSTAESLRGFQDAAGEATTGVSLWDDLGLAAVLR